MLVGLRREERITEIESPEHLRRRPEHAGQPLLQRTANDRGFRLARYLCGLSKPVLKDIGQVDRRLHHHHTYRVPYVTLRVRARGICWSAPDVGLCLPR